MKSEDANNKTEIKKNPFDLLGYLGMRPKKIEEKYKKYASLNRRMAAVTTDVAISAVTISPIIDWIAKTFIHTREITADEFARIQSLETGATIEFIKLLIDSGKLQEFLMVSTMQTFSLLIIFGICWKLWSATPGKILFRLKIVDATTEKSMTNKQILLRLFGYAFLFIGVILVSFNKKRQAWHDKVANTVVIIVPINWKKKNKTEDDSEILIEKSIETASAIS
jgi:uncharacterized RDD family membrane protein YckC